MSQFFGRVKSYVYICRKIEKSMTNVAKNWKRAFMLALMALALTVGVEAETRWYNPLAQPVPVVTGRYWHDELAGGYRRLPDRAKERVRPGVWYLSGQSAGLGVDFHTNAPEITVRYGVKGNLAMPHMPATGVSGVDLYATDKNGRQRWCAGKYVMGDTITYSFRQLEYPEARPEWGYNFHLSLPMYNEVVWLEIGVDEEAKFDFFPLTTEAPIVVYGTSIAQGACASRPGMAWTNILQRETGHDIVNLGFSGNGLLEPELFDLLAEIEAKAYVIDCMPNMCEPKELAVLHDRIVAGVKRLRRDRKAPILLVEHSGYTNEDAQPAVRKKYDDANRELLRAYDDLMREGVAEVYYMTHDEIGQEQDDMVEGIHPNDLGMRRIADAYRRKLACVLHEDCHLRTVFAPITQQRDPYDWQQRHRNVLKVNAEEPPKVVLIGNSITHYWAGLPTGRLVRGEDSWSDLWKGTVAHNLGFGWDRLENVFWRIYHGELDGYEAEKVILLLGTNNVDFNTDEEIAAGIAEVVRAVKVRQPGAEVFVCGVLPRADRFARIAPLNRAIRSALAQQGCSATYVDLSPAVLNADGTLRSELFSDGLHPTREGYREIANRLKTEIF